MTPVAIGDAGGRTSFRVTNVADPAAWTVAGPVADAVQLRAAGDDLEVEVPVRDEAVLLRGPAG